MHGNLHKNVNENMFLFTFLFIFFEFYGGQLKKQKCYSLTLLISYMVFNLFEMDKMVEFYFFPI